MDLSIQDVDLAENSFQNIGIVFSINPRFYDEDMLKKDSFLKYGISRFWPNTEKREEILIEKPEELEGVRSEDATYYGLVKSEDDLFETVNALAKLPEILSVSIVRKAFPGGEPPYEEWTVDKTEYVNLKLSGGTIAEGFNENGPRLNQIAAIEGIKQGIAVIEVSRGGFGANAEAKCIVIVYEPGSKYNPGDLNHNGEIDAKDALQALKHSVGLVSLNEADKQTVDLNQDNEVDAGDALLMLKIAVGIL